VEAWTKVIVLSAGGAVGVNARYWLGVWMNKWASPQFPWATFTINVSGSFLIGVLTIALTQWLPHQNLRLLVITGFLGGYTTFSTFEYDSAMLWERGETRLVAVNIVGSVVAGFVAVLFGIALARGLGPRQVAAASPRAHHQEAASPQSSQVSVNGPASPGAGIVRQGDNLDTQMNGRTG
jgi:fluoride exporter